LVAQSTIQPQALLIGPDMNLLGMSPGFPVSQLQIGAPLNANLLAEFEEPILAALEGEENPSRQYIRRPSDEAILIALPVPGSGIRRNQIVGILLYSIEPQPVQEPALTKILSIAGRIFPLLALGAVVTGALFGAQPASRLTRRLRRISYTVSEWNRSNFSTKIPVTRRDEIDQLAAQLNQLAGQLKELLDMRQQITQEKKDGLATYDLHDSISQQAFAASLHLGAANSLMENNQPDAKEHLQKAEILVNQLRLELTDLIHSLHPLLHLSSSELNKLWSYVLTWSQHKGINAHINFQPNLLVPDNLANTCFQITCSALELINEYDCPTSILIKLEREKDLLQLTIHLNDICINDDVLHNKGELQSMRQLAVSVGGDLIIKSLSDQETQLRATFPL
jgi:signal transduction histidine kinase